MELYERINNKINVYQAVAEEDCLRNYRKTMLQQCGTSPFWELDFTDQQILVFLANQADIGIEILNSQRLYTKGDLHYSCLCQSVSERLYDKVLRTKLLDNYLEGSLSACPFFRVKDNHKEQKQDTYLYHFIMTEDKEVVNYLGDDYYFINNILNLPEELGALELFQRGRFEQLLTSAKQEASFFSLYQFKQIDQFDSTLLDEKINPAVDKMIMASTKVLQKVKKFST